MLKKTAFLLIILPLAFVAKAQNIAEHDSQAHHHHGDNETTLQLSHGKKWPVDESLHKGMTSIKSLIKKPLSRIHHDEFKADEYSKLATDIEHQIHYIFKNCKLPQDADAQLHIILAKTLGGIKQMRAESDQRDGAIKIIGALQNYTDYFDDKAWTPLFH